MHTYLRRTAAPLAAVALGLALLAGTEPLAEPADPLIAAAASGPASGAVGAARPSAAASGPWTAAWGASPQLPSTGFTPNWSQEGFSRQTVRQVVRITKDGDRARIRLSNAYGTSPLRITGATIARTAGGAAVEKGSVRHLTFAGKRSVSVPAHAELRSDAAPLPLKALESVTVTLYLAGTTGPATFHSQAWADTYRAEGDHRADVSGKAFTDTSQSWYYLSGVDVGGAEKPRGNDGVVLFGDSITDSFGSTPNTDRRYSDAVAELSGRPVVNSGIGGNLVLNDSAWYGERGTARFGRDALDQPGVSTVVVLEGVNDIGFSEVKGQPTFKPSPVVSSRELIAGYRQLIRSGHARGLRVIGSTLLPLKGSDHWGAHAAKVSDEVNHWIRTSGEFDAVADFDKALADPADADRINPAYDSGDALHPNDAGYRRMAAEATRVL
ncbi:SGNH/GDSL hydrolase family protein [Streptomyces sp. NBC_01142]|uniref:SGNH/GDSL hydrolase family protein n=1 Tax=Streptomyces sp. NBC_01142 TaxID=2975865 RepID=UPI00224CE5D1|nr:SGNH/GDSL hydrolase family protein [Streptomyces sp. NBC_01142]MCX4818953.1 SGNH/GDSL hydrolase family protein [Streptomyces sp. NBC_01142]